METPRQFVRYGFRMSNSKEMASFIKYAGIENFKVFNLHKLTELHELVENGLHDPLIIQWRKGRYGKKVMPVYGWPYGGKTITKPSWFRHFLWR